MSDLVERLRAQIGGDVVEAGFLLDEAAREIERLRGVADRLRGHLNSRPAMNAALVEEYAVWSGKMYLVDLGGEIRPERAMALMRTNGGEQ